MAKLIWKPQKSFRDYFNTAKEIKIYRSVFKNGKKYFVPYGGRGSGKTVTMADALAVEASLRPVRILVTREFQVSIKESIKDEIEDAIRARGLEHFFDMQETVIKGLNGSRFIFKGIRNNIKNLKSISNVDIVICEEAQDIPEDSWAKLLPSIRPKSGRDPIFIIIFNPGNELDATYQRWVVNPPDRCVSKLINYYDNEFFPDFLEEQRLNDKRFMPLKQYEHEWLGKPLGSGDDVIIDLEWIKAARFASDTEGWKVTGKKVVGFDPSGEGKDHNASVFMDGNCITRIDEWLKSHDLREASERAFSIAVENNAKFFVWDDCGGLGNGVSVFVNDEKIKVKQSLVSDGQNAKARDFNKLVLHAFNAGNAVHRPNSRISGTKKTNGEIYTNLKAQAWGEVSQRFYNTYRYVILGERDINPSDMISIDIEDNQMFNKLAKELSSPTWVKSETNSKKKVESKDKMEKRTGQPSPNIADAIVMTMTPTLPAGSIKDLL